MRSSLHLSLRAGRLCAIRVDQGVEIARPLPIARIAGAQGSVLGVSVVRGAATPVVDLAALLGERDEIGRIVIARAGGGTVVLAVSAVLGFRAFDPPALEAGRALARGIASPFIAAVVAEGGETVTVIEVAEIARAVTAAGGASAGVHV